MTTTNNCTNSCCGSCKGKFPDIHDVTKEALCEWLDHLPLHVCKIIMEKLWKDIYDFAKIKNDNAGCEGW